MAKSMNKRLHELGGKEYDEGFWGHKRSDKPIDVLFLAKNDWANTGFKFWRMAVEHLGLNAVMFKGEKLLWNPPREAPIHPSLTSMPIKNSPTVVMAPGLESLIESAHVVHVFASTYPMCAVDWRKTNLIVQHGGTVYRQDPDECNKVFNPIARRAIVQTPDLYGLGAENETLIYFACDTDYIKPDFSEKKPGRIVAGHFPSNPDVKGTDGILKVFKEIKSSYPEYFDWCAVTEKIPWKEQLKLYKKCDVIVEACAPDQGSKSYGEFGNTALEAAASGCAVITHHTHPDLYKENYGDLGVLVANTTGEIKTWLEGMIGQPSHMGNLKRMARQWVEEKHSIPATADRLWNTVYKDFF
jgi:glycosyltransferase involved in cell wall biosynthesis